MKRKTVGGDERDAFTRVSRRATNWKPGEVKRIKERANRRERRAVRRELAAWYTRRVSSQRFLWVTPFSRSCFLRLSALLERSP